MYLQVGNEVREAKHYNQIRVAWHLNGTDQLKQRAPLRQWYARFISQMAGSLEGDCKFFFQTAQTCGTKGE